MNFPKQLATSEDFWTAMLVPDYNDFCKNDTCLRAAFHLSISLFHMSDWIFHTHESYIKTHFTFTNRPTKKQSNPCQGPFFVKSSKEFADSLEDKYPDFLYVRKLAHSAKHLKLDHVDPGANVPSHAANVHITTVGGNNTNVGVKEYGGFQIMLEGDNGNHLPLKPILDNVYSMWKNLKQSHNW